MKQLTNIPFTVAAAVVVVAGLCCTSCGSQNHAETSRTGRPRVTFMLLDFAGSPMSGEKAGEVLDRITEYTDTDPEFQFVPHDNYDEKMGLVFSNPENMPMIMYINKITSGIVDAAESGAFWDLNEFIWDKEAYPNLSQANREIAKSLAINKKLIGLYRARDLGRYGLGYRTDWAEKLGLSEPKTVDDVYNMLYAFRNLDPDGNGKRDTFGLAMCRYTGPLDIIQTWFGCGTAGSKKTARSFLSTARKNTRRRSTG